MATRKTIFCLGFLMSEIDTFTFLYTDALTGFFFVANSYFNSKCSASQSFSVSISLSLQRPVLFPVALYVLLCPLSVSTLTLPSSQVAHSTPSLPHLLLFCLHLYVRIIFCAISQNS